MTAIDPDIKIDLDIPPEFHEVPLDEFIEDRAGAQQDVIDALALADRERREGIGWFLEAMAQTMREGPVVGTAFCAVEIDGAPSTATLTVATRSVPSDDPLVFAQGSYESLRERYDAVSLERLGAVTGVLARRVREVDGRESHQITAVVPVVGQRTAVFVTVATDDEHNLDSYEQVARDAAASVRLAAG